MCILITFYSLENKCFTCFDSIISMSRCITFSLSTKLKLECIRVRVSKVAKKKNANQKRLHFCPHAHGNCLFTFDQVCIARLPRLPHLASSYTPATAGHFRPGHTFVILLDSFIINVKKLIIEANLWQFLPRNLEMGVLLLRSCQNIKSGFSVKLFTRLMYVQDAAWCPQQNPLGLGAKNNYTDFYSISIKVFPKQISENQLGHISRLLPRPWSASSI